MQKNPCYQCQDRKVGCHGSCEKYKEWREEYDKEQDVIRKSRNEYWKYLADKKRVVEMNKRRHRH